VTVDYPPSSCAVVKHRLAANIAQRKKTKVNVKEIATTKSAAVAVCAPFAGRAMSPCKTQDYLRGAEPTIEAKVFALWQVELQRVRARSRRSGRLLEANQGKPGPYNGSLNKSVWNPAIIALAC